MFYERGCQEQTSPDRAADSNLLAASPVVYGAIESLGICPTSSKVFACFNTLV
jgi:hypothetical protein